MKNNIFNNKGAYKKVGKVALKHSYFICSLLALVGVLYGQFTGTSVTDNLFLLVLGIMFMNLYGFDLRIQILENEE